MTYGAEMPVIHYDGMTIVAESPHSYGANGTGNGKKAIPPVHVHEPGGDPHDETGHAPETAGHPESKPSPDHEHSGDSEQEASHV